MADSSIFYSPEDIQAYVEEQHYTTNDVSKIPLKILNTFKKGGYILTTNTSLYNNGRCNSLLFCYGENNTQKRGYLIMATKNYLELENILVLFTIKNKKLIVLSFYNLPYKITDWVTAKQFLKPNNGQMRFGGKIK